MMHKKGTASLLCCFCPNCPNLSKQKKKLDKSELGTFYKVTYQCSSNCQGNERQNDKLAWMEKTKKIQQLNIMWDPRLDCGTVKGYL